MKDNIIVCPLCKGNGRWMNYGHMKVTCPTCKGEKTIVEKEVKNNDSIDDCIDSYVDNMGNNDISSNYKGSKPYENTRRNYVKAEEENKTIKKKIKKASKAKKINK